MFEFVKKWFFTGLALLSTLKSVNLSSCISINNQKCKVRLQIVNVYEPVFYRSGSCNKINDPYARMQAFVIINNVRMMINVGVNIKN